MNFCLPALLNGLESELNKFALLRLFVGAMGALNPAKSESKSVFDIAVR